MLLTRNAAAKAGSCPRSMVAALESIGLWDEVVAGDNNAFGERLRSQRLPARPPPTSYHDIDLPGVDDEARSGTRRQDRGTAP